MSLHTFLPSSTEVLSLLSSVIEVVVTLRGKLVLLWIRLCGCASLILSAGSPQIRDS